MEKRDTPFYAVRHYRQTRKGENVNRMTLQYGRGRAHSLFPVRAAAVLLARPLQATDGR